MPEVSVIIPCYCSHVTLPICLEALGRQTFPDFEVILVDSTPGDERACRIASEYPFTAVHRVSERLLPHAARNRGAAEARGDILIFTDPDMRAESDWLERLVDAHRQGRTVVGGAVSCPRGYWNLAVHFTKYGWWLPGGRLERRPQIASGNTSMRRDVFEAAGSYPSVFWAGDTELAWRLREMGQEIWFEPTAVVCHLDEASPGRFLRERFERGRDFGRARVSRYCWSRGRCALYLLLFPMLPIVMAGKACWFASRSGHFVAWLATLPIQLAGYATWCAGEAVAHWERLWKR
jgi:GT2 family glycosyltransferase